MKVIKHVVEWVREDYRSNRVRCVLEVFAWMLSILCAVWMAATLPNPPFFILYPLFITQCVIFAWAAHTRKSVGMLANYMLLVAIDTVGLLRLILK